MPDTRPSMRVAPVTPTNGTSKTAARRESVPRNAARDATTRASRRKSGRANPVDSRTGGGATRAKRTLGIGSGRKPTVDTAGFGARLTSLVVEAPALFAIWNTPELAPAFREELMVAVARQNHAPYCEWAHSTWAKAVGASKAELAAIEQLDPRGLDRGKWAALTFVRALAAADFKRVPGEVRREVEAHFSPREISDIELVAKVIDLTNRTTNTYEAMLSRLQGTPRAETRVVDEIAMSGVFLTVAPSLLLLLSRYSKRSLLDTTRSLIDHVRRFYALEARGSQH